MLPQFLLVEKQVGICACSGNFSQKNIALLQMNKTDETRLLNYGEIR